MIGLYGEADVYTNQLRALEAAVRQSPQAAAPRFLLAYHYITAGHLDAAISQLKEVSQLQPRDAVAAQLLKQLEQAAQGAKVTTPTASSLPAGPAGGAQPAAVKPGNLVGTWAADPNADTSIRLTLDGSGHFVWRVTTQGKSQEFQGDETHGNGILTLARTAQEGQPPMVGRVTWLDDDHFGFKIMAGPPDDPGLSFTRAH
jgi:hypothetical protein